MTVTLALIGTAALWLLYGWLLAAIICSYLSERKGYGEKPGLACGLLLYPIGVLVWLVWPPRPESKWKTLGPFGRGEKRRAAAAASAAEDQGVRGGTAT